MLVLVLLELTEEKLGWGDSPVDTIEAIGGFIEVIGNILEFLSRIGEIGGKDEGIIKEQDD